MSLTTGDKLGPYEIIARIGKGGMGEVYRAHDTRLGRDVAIKVSTEHFSKRFEREARAIASLNHPNICTLHDVGSNYLVMELVEGTTLSERIARGAIPLDESLKIVSQIADALEAAHENGIVHRDLKPANIKINGDGVVKVLDFGLASTPGVAGKFEDSLTLDTNLTEAGIIMGTAPYMAPEQARGETVDKRADIWAFGVVLFEMLTGRMLFGGKTVSDTLASVLTKEPEWDRVPPKTERLLRRCLERDPKRRLRDIREARFLLEDDQRTAAPISGNRWLWKISTAILAIVLTLAVFRGISMRHTVASVMQLSVDLGDDASLAPRRGTSMALSPDGSQIVFVTGQALVKSRLALRRLDQTKAVTLAGTEGAEAPFFSADGKFIAFFADGKLKKTDAAGSAPVTLCDAPSQREGSWGEDNNIVFAATNHGGLSRVSSSGGIPQSVTELDKQRGEWTHRFPQVLPGAEAVMFASGADSTGEANIDVQSFKTGKRKTLIQAGAYGHYLPSGHIIFMHRGTLFVARMDLARLEVTGPPVPVLEDVSFRTGTGAAGFTFSSSGMLVYVLANPEEKLRPISVVDQSGKEEMLPVPRARYSHPRISPDGTRLAVTVDDASGTNIYIYDRTAQRLSRLLTLNGNSGDPVWTPDGKNLIFFSDVQNPGPGIYWTRADGGVAPQRLLKGSGQSPHSFSRDAARLTFDRGGAMAGIWILPLDWSDAAGPKAGIPQRFVSSTESDTNSGTGAFSPDGRWLAYTAAPFGLPEVFVRASSGQGQWQISAGGNGGEMPVWSSDGRTLFYQGVLDPRIMAMDYSVAGDSFSAGRPRLWSESQGSLQAFDVMPDGKSIVGIPSAPQKEPTHAIFLLNFFDELAGKVPLRGK